MPDSSSFSHCDRKQISWFSCFLQSLLLSFALFLIFNQESLYTDNISYIFDVLQTILYWLVGAPSGWLLGVLGMSAQSSQCAKEGVCHVCTRETTGKHDSNAFHPRVSSCCFVTRFLSFSTCRQPIALCRRACAVLRWLEVKPCSLFCTSAPLCWSVLLEVTVCLPTLFLF